MRLNQTHSGILASSTTFRSVLPTVVGEGCFRNVRTCSTFFPSNPVRELLQSAYFADQCNSGATGPPPRDGGAEELVEDPAVGLHLRVRTKGRKLKV